MRRVVLVGFGLLIFLASRPARAVEQRVCRHILLDTKEKAEAVRKEIEAAVASGTDVEDAFIAAARKYSFDIATKKTGGELQAFTRRGVEKAFGDAAFALKEKGEIAGPVKGSRGWHLIQLVEVRGEREKPPAIASIAPAEGSKAGGTEVRIKGENFQKGAVVRFAGTPAAKVTIVSATEITCTTPAGSEGAVELEVRNPDGLQAVLKGAFTYVTPKRPEKPKRVAVELQLEEKAFEPGDPMTMEIFVRNDTDAPATVPRPELLPLGLSIRAPRPGAQAGAPALQFDEITVPNPPVIEIGPGAFVGIQVDLATRFEGLHPTGRHAVAWYRPTFFNNLEGNDRFKPVVEAEGYEGWKDAWQRLYARPVFLDYREPFSGDRTYFVQFSVTGGRFYVQLDRDRPKEVAYFWNLVRRDFYRDLTFHKVLAGQFVAGGDPFGDGTGRPEEILTLSDVPKDRKHVRGTFSLAVRAPVGRGGGGAIGSIFFICLKDLPVFDGLYLPIGKVVEGMAVVERLVSEKGPRRIYSATVATAEELPPSIREKLQIEKPREPAGPLPLVEIEVENRGRLVAELYEDDAPNTVANFIELAEGEFYKGLTFHRVVSGEIVQAGDPTGTGRGGPGYKIRDEVNPRKHVRGALAMALKGQKAGRSNSAGSQFYICLRSQPTLDGTYTVFGRVTKGLEVLDRIEKGDKIAAIRVLRKRDHEYKAEKIGVPETPSGVAPAPSTIPAPAKKAEAPAKKAEAPAKKAEAPAKKAEAPAKKAEAPAKKAAKKEPSPRTVGKKPE